MKNKYKLKFLKLILGLIISLSIPILILSPKYSLEELITKQYNSIAFISIIYFLNYFTIKSFSKFPGLLSKLFILPSITLWLTLILIIILVLRLQYSGAFLSIGTITLISISYIFLKMESDKKLSLAYINQNRTKILVNIPNINWIPLHDYKLTKKKINAIIVDLYDDNLSKDWQKFLANCTLKGIPVINVQQAEESLTGRIKIKHMYENNLGSLLPSSTYLLIKKIFDIIFIIILLPIIIPIFLIVSIIIKLESKGSIFYCQTRIGYKGKAFKIYKFRSMYTNNNSSCSAKFANQEDRITKSGKWIRKFRIDELPQIINILKGEMSLIGPRPEQKEFVNEFEKSIPFYNYRHIVKPGISGWSQVMHGYASNTEQTQIKIEYDFYYIKNFSFSLDMLIFLKTIKTIITGFGAK